MASTSNNSFCGDILPKKHNVVLNIYYVLWIIKSIPDITLRAIESLSSLFCIEVLKYWILRKKKQTFWPFRCNTIVGERNWLITMQYIALNKHKQAVIQKQYLLHFKWTAWAHTYISQYSTCSVVHACQLAFMYQYKPIYQIHRVNNWRNDSELWYK